MTEEEKGEIQTGKTKKKKVPPRRRKARKEKESPIIKAIRLSVETGKVSFGYNACLKSMNQKKEKPKLVIVSDNIPEVHLNEVKHSALTSKVSVYTFNGNSKELAAICGKPFLVSTLSIFDEGTSNILKLAIK